MSNRPSETPVRERGLSGGMAAESGDLYRPDDADGDDTTGRVERLCAKAKQPVRADILDTLDVSGITIGAVCVYHDMIAPAVAALAMREPVGVVGAFCPDEAPLPGLVSVMGPATAMGNRAVLVASEPFPLAATDFYQVLETSDVPAGMVNILTGDHAELAPHLAGHLDLDAVWSFSSTDLAETIEAASAGNLKRA